MTHRFETIQSLISAIRFESYEYIVPLCNSFHIDFEDPPTLNVCPFKKMECLCHYSPRIRVHRFLYNYPMRFLAWPDNIRLPRLLVISLLKIAVPHK